MYSIYRQCVAVRGWWVVLNCVVDHILQEFYTLFLTRWRTYKIATPPQTKVTSKDDIKGFVSLKFLRLWAGLATWGPPNRSPFCQWEIIPYLRYIINNNSFSRCFCGLKAERKLISLCYGQASAIIYEYVFIWIMNVINIEVCVKNHVCYSC